MITREQCEGIVRGWEQKCNELLASSESLLNRLRDLELQSRWEPTPQGAFENEHGQPYSVDPSAHDASGSNAGEFHAWLGSHCALRLARKKQRREERHQCSADGEQMQL